MRAVRLIFALCLLALPAVVAAASSPVHQAPVLTARLITAENGVAPESGTLSAGLVIEMQEGWKTYWRTPGEVGLPPELDWTGSENVAETEILFPAPTRFTAFDIENFGYGGTVTFPIGIRLKNPGAEARLSAQVRLLVCKDICIPEDFTLTLALGNGTGIDPDAAERLTEALARVPGTGPETGVALEAAHIDDTTLTVAFTRAGGFSSPDIFPELGDASFGKPEVLLNGDRTRLWASFPRLYVPETSLDLGLTVTDRGFAATLAAPLSEAPPPPAARRGLLWTALIAVLGGLILNVMPCVLPVLSIKLASAVSMAQKGRARIRTGFLLAAFGVLAFFWALAAVTWALQGMGQAVGWGIQFQSPLFLATMIAILVLFAANLAGVFEISLPAALQTRLSTAGGQGYLGDFATGAFAAVLATPCSAPLLGTAVAFALSGGPLEIGVIFTALGLGLALPYLVVAARPGLVAMLPKPGHWMVTLKLVMGALLALTALWLLFVLAAIVGWPGALVTAALLGVALALFALPRLPARNAVITGLTALAIALPAIRPTAPNAAPTATAYWAAFDTDAIASHIDLGHVVFVDVTADWCLTCKANKALVLDRGAVAEALAAEDIIPMQADWTRPDPAISSYLQSFDRYGIPFNAVYGPNAPAGIPLPELLNTDAVLDALNRAGS